MAKARRTGAAIISTIFVAVSLLAALAYRYFAGPEASGSAVRNAGERVGLLEVDFLDVGEGDCALVRCGGKSLLIDAGRNGSAGYVVESLKKRGLGKIDYLIGTHPDADHIGGLDKVIDNFEIGKVLMPKLSSNSLSFEDVLTALEAKALLVSDPVQGTRFPLGSAEFIILSTGTRKGASDNDSSIVIRLTFGSVSFLFMADAEADLEKRVMESGFDIRSDVLKVAHHGSETSSSPELLDAVKPKYAIISVGTPNGYGHPSAEVLDRLKSAGIEVLRTDERGDIGIETDGKELRVGKSR